MKNLKENNSQVSKGNDYMPDMNISHSINSENLPFQEGVSSHEQAPETDWTTSVSIPIDEILTAFEVMGTKGKSVASSIYSNRVFHVVDTSEELMKMGFWGTEFTIKYGTLSRHFKQDEDHTLTESEWRRLPSALYDPNIKIEPYNSQYRIWTNLFRKNKQLVVAVSVKKDRNGQYHNVIKSLFFKKKSLFFI